MIVHYISIIIHFNNLSMGPIIAIWKGKPTDKL